MLSSTLRSVFGRSPRPSFEDAGGRAGEGREAPPLVMSMFLPCVDYNTRLAPWFKTLPAETERRGGLSRRRSSRRRQRKSATSTSTGSPLRRASKYSAISQEDGDSDSFRGRTSTIGSLLSSGSAGSSRRTSNHDTSRSSSRRSRGDDLCDTEWQQISLQERYMFMDLEKSCGNNFVVECMHDGYYALHIFDKLKDKVCKYHMHAAENKIAMVNGDGAKFRNLSALLAHLATDGRALIATDLQLPSTWLGNAAPPSISTSSFSSGDPTAMGPSTADRNGVADLGPSTLGSSTLGGGGAVFAETPSSGGLGGDAANSPSLSPSVLAVSGARTGGEYMEVQDTEVWFRDGDQSCEMDLCGGEPGEFVIVYPNGDSIHRNHVANLMMIDDDFCMQSFRVFSTNGEVHLQGADTRFDTVRELVHHHRTSPGTLPRLLVMPAPRQSGALPSAGGAAGWQPEEAQPEPGSPPYEDGKASLASSLLSALGPLGNCSDPAPSETATSEISFSTDASTAKVVGVLL